MADYVKAKNLASECFSCIAKPCMKGCPLSNDITSAIALVKEEKYEEAYNKFTETTVLSSICGRVCPHEKQCQGKCIRGIKMTAVEIGNIEAFLGDLAIENGWKLACAKEEKEFKVAVIGGGPAGLTCAAFLRREGIQVTIFEKHDKLGGILVHGIPDFRLPKDIVENNIKQILDLGVEVKLNCELGKDYTIDSLKEEYDAIFVGIGANVSSKMNIEGEDLNGVFGANEVLENNTHPDYAKKTVVVSGGGNVAMDIARTANKMGAKVYVVYRRSENEMPAEKKEIKEAREEGVEFIFQTNILKVLGNGSVEKIECVKTELVQKEGETRLSPVNIEGSNHFIDTDYVMMAVGSNSEAKVVENLGLTLNKWDRIEVDDEYHTSDEKVFAAGDIAGVKSTVAFAAQSGRDAAKSIIKMLNNK